MRKSLMSKIILSSLISFIFLLSNSCRFQVATKKDATALNEQGSFGGSAPAWASLPRDQKVRLPEDSGVLPQTFAVPESVSFTANANSSSSVSADIGRGLEINKQQSVNEQKLKLKTQQEKDNESVNNSEIGKIEKECPGIENSLVDAIKTEDTKSRIKKYLVLTKRCSNSSSIWLWLAKDYSTLNRINDSRRCAEASLSIDPSNTEAKAFLNSLNQSNAQ